MHRHDESFLKHLKMLAESSEEYELEACLAKTVNPSNKKWRLGFFERVLFSMERSI